MLNIRDFTESQPLALSGPGVIFSATPECWIATGYPGAEIQLATGAPWDRLMVFVTACDRRDNQPLPWGIVL